MAKKAIVIKDILDLLADGKSRKEINELYGFNPAEAKFVWDNEKLKGVKKAKYSIGIELVDEPIGECCTDTCSKPLSQNIYRKEGDAVPFPSGANSIGII